MSATNPITATCPSDDAGRIFPLLDLPRHILLDLLRSRLSLFTLLALAALVLAGCNSTPATPTPGAGIARIDIVHVDAGSNNKQARLEGAVTRGPIYDPGPQELRFYLSDSTGEILVISPRTTTLRLLDRQQIPMVGDHVAVEGLVHAHDTYAALELGDPDRLEITHPTPRPVKIGDIGPANKLQVVTIAGEVRAIRAPSQGLTLISVGDATGQIDVAVYSDITILHGNLPSLQAGDTIQVNGTVTLDQDTPQLTLGHTRDLVKTGANSLALQATPSATATSSPEATVKTEPSPTPPPATAIPATPRPTSPPATAVKPTVTSTNPPLPAGGRTIGSLSVNDANQTVVIAGRITQASSFSAGMRYTLDDGTGTITMLLWSDLVAGFPDRAALRAGARVQAKGKVNVYNGALEVVPGQSSDLTLIALSTLPLPSLRPIASLNAGDAGTIIIVRGTATKIQDFSKGKYIDLSDDSGKVRIVVYTDVLNALPDKTRLTQGAVLTVTGQVNLYRGELEVVPDRGGITIQ